MADQKSLYHHMAQVKRERKEEFNGKMKALRESIAGHMAVCERLGAAGVDRCPANYGDAIKLAVAKGVVSEKDEQRAQKGRLNGNDARHKY